MRRGESGVPKAIAGTVFAGALLLFAVQPLIARYILPWFGGGPGVWTTCMLFFQVVLLAGYAYAHALQRLVPRRQVIVHLVLLAAALALLPITPAASFAPDSAADPIPRILTLLVVCVGAPAFLLASTGPLLQRWLAFTRPAASPYPLYALSNAGSLLALLSYPFLIEPASTRRQQAVGWSIAFVGYALLTVACALPVWRAAAAPLPSAAADARDRTPRALERVLWVLLPACGSVLLLAVTNQLCLDVASVPFLWVLPLSIYLVTFILCFHSERWYSRTVFLCLLQAGMVAEAWVLSLGERKHASVLLQIGVQSAVLFVACMVCHGELVRLKPAPRRLTGFYLAIAGGGALGGALVALAAPVVFQGYFELHVGLVACLVLALGCACADPRWFLYRGRPVWAAIPLSLLVVVVAATLWRQAHAVIGRADLLTRDFYGVLAVSTYDAQEPQARRRVLTHGTTLHGLQFDLPEKRGWPTAYYGRESGVGVAIRHYQASGPVRIGAVGLGAGTIAAYGRPGDSFRFYEIDPDVERLARERFTFLSDSKARVEVALGDARLTLEREAPQGFDLIVLDAFSSDAIPVHLLTKEAFDVYLRHLKPEGTIAAHISNAYLDLRPVIFGLSDRAGMTSVLLSDLRGEQRGGGPDAAVIDALRGLENSFWILATKDRALIESEEFRRGGRLPAAAIARVPTWTDERSNLFRILRK